MSTFLSKEQLLGIAMASLYYSSRSCFTFFKKQVKNHKGRMLLFLTPRKSGISTALRSVQNSEDQKKNLKIIDEDDIMNSLNEVDKANMLEWKQNNRNLYESRFFRIVHAYLKEIRSLDKTANILFFTHETNLISFLQRPAHKVIVLVPSLDLFKKLNNTLSTQDYELLTTSREQLQNLNYPKTFYKNFTELKSFIEQLVNVPTKLAV